MMELIKRVHALPSVHMLVTPVLYLVMQGVTLTRMVTC